MKQKARSIAKITRPLLARYHPRNRVFEQLDNCRDFPVILVTGPAGCGKTTLVNSYLKERKMRSLWYQLNESDSDPATFFYYMRHAAKIIAPRRRICLPLLTPEYQTGLNHFTMRYFEQLYERLPRHSVMVFDNYQEIPESSVFHVVLRQGITEIPPDIQVIIISRTSAPPELVRLEANRQMTTIGWEDLRLTPEETAGLAELLAPGHMSKEKIHYFHYLSDGWAAGVVLMALKDQTEGMEPRALSRQAPEVVFDYFASEVFERMDQSSQEFLMKTAYLPSMTTALAEELSGNPESGRILSELARHNYFVERRYHSNFMYSYHPLFREFLLERSKTTLSQQALMQVITEAASLLDKNGQTDDAIDLIAKAGGWETMNRFLMDHAPSMLAQGRHRLLERMLGNIPPDILCVSPWLQFWLGSSCLPFNARQSVKYFYEAYDQFKQQGDMPGFFLAWSGIADAIAYAYTSRTTRVDELIRDLEERRDSFDRLPSDEIRTRVAVGMFSMLALHRPKHVDAQEWAKLALNLARTTLNKVALSQTLLTKWFYQWQTGVLKDIVETIEAMQQLSREENVSEMAQLTIKLGEAQFYDFATMHDECLSAVEAGLDLAQISGIHMWDTFLIGHGAMSCHNVCDVKGAVRYIDLLRSYEDDPRPWVQVNMDFVKARHSMICGNNAEASRYVERGLLLESQATAPSTFCMHRVLYAHVMYCLGKVEKAVKILSQAGFIAERIGSEHFMVMIKFLKARIDFDEGHDDRALACLRSAFPLAKEWGSLGSLWDIPQVTAFLCAKALEEGIEVDFVKEIIHRRHLMPDDLPVMLEHWPWPVKIFTLGCFRIEKDDQPVEFSRKTQKKPLDMLKTLVAKGGSQVSVDTVADLLWPDADGDLAMQSCATTLHRLRKQLGYAEAVMLTNGFLALDLHLCWVDSHVFITLLDKMDSLLEKAQTEYEKEHACNLGCCALAIFRGKFLADEEWIPDVISMREYLNARFFRAISRIGEHLVACSQWEKALAVFEQGLTVDDCSEDCYQGAMVCLEHLGRKSAALALFEQCRKTLDAKLGIGPSPQTEARGRSLRSGGIM